MPILRKDEVLNEWGVLIANAQQRGEEIFTTTQRLIQETKVPNVRMERRRVAPGIIRGLFGTRRDFLVVTETSNAKLKPFQMFINVRDYGNNLAVSWYLTHRPSFWTVVVITLMFIPGLNFFVLPFALLLLLRSMMRGKSGPDLDLFDQQDLKDYVTNAHHCLLQAVDNLMLGLNQDPSKIERTSRGFLNIS